MSESEKERIQGSGEAMSASGSRRKSTRKRTSQGGRRPGKKQAKSPQRTSASDADQVRRIEQAVEELNRITAELKEVQEDLESVVRLLEAADSLSDTRPEDVDRLMHKINGLRKKGHA
ncbi:MAG: hypothetical protein K9N48_07610 [Verrucomicrobia bacterium]|nr:hypothetical protein [Verrucomicrobiota bacterium]MCF7708042.1 hypothetical protein [Verrucomicrobiota bacterium]